MWARRLGIIYGEHDMSTKGCYAYGYKLCVCVWCVGCAEMANIFSKRFDLWMIMFHIYFISVYIRTVQPNCLFCV